MRVLEILGVFEFQNVRRWLGLSMASLVAFFVGLGCLLAVVAVGVVYSVQNLADFQALQSYRMQWLLAAVAAFVAGILLKKTPDSREYNRAPAYSRSIPALSPVRHSDPSCNRPCSQFTGSGSAIVRRC